ncbi:hypothetical protein K2173_025895 [Erythroxylum novogranatense]|uniref:Glycosyltransferase n=1 Tax=Erythroxylum novogranatense TaxID=1862640 RepID=A0AAV8TW24_9ROSI|nr:hypothetical protein K2173_025895 [Erythroxylum novogranatense]
MAESKKLHVAVFPWLAFGHLMPLFELGKLIAQKGHKISFISTTRNIRRLPQLPPNLTPLVELVSLSLPREDNLPQEAEATMDVAPHLVPYLKRAFDGLQESLTQFLEASKPDWIIYDFAPYWLPPIASRLGISRAFFNILSSWSICFFGHGVRDEYEARTKPEHFIVPPKWIPFPSNLAFRLYDAKKMFSQLEQTVELSGCSDLFRVSSCMSGCEVFAMRSCLEVEAEWIHLYQAWHHQQPVVPLGVLPPSVEDNNGSEKDDSYLYISDWLNKQEKGSVVYIALGSEATLGQEDLTELALGLELSGLPFFWILRKQGNSDNPDSVELPDRFQERTEGRGIVWTSWAPQLRILRHDSVGGFLTHCGWSSIIEGLAFGRALIMLPIHVVDQGLNSRILEEKKAGKEITRNEEDGSFTRDSVAETLRLVMVDENGRIYREGAKEMMKIFGDRGIQDRYFSNFVGFLHDHRFGR